MKSQKTGRACDAAFVALPCSRSFVDNDFFGLLRGARANNAKDIARLRRKMDARARYFDRSRALAVIGAGHSWRDEADFFEVELGQHRSRLELINFFDGRGLRRNWRSIVEAEMVERARQLLRGPREAGDSQGGGVSSTGTGGPALRRERASIESVLFRDEAALFKGPKSSDVSVEQILRDADQPVDDQRNADPSPLTGKLAFYEPWHLHLGFDALASVLGFAQLSHFRTFTSHMHERTQRILFRMGILIPTHVIFLCPFFPKLLAPVAPQCCGSKHSLDEGPKHSAERDAERDGAARTEKAENDRAEDVEEGTDIMKERSSSHEQLQDPEPQEPEHNGEQDVSAGALRGQKVQFLQMPYPTINVFEDDIDAEQVFTDDGEFWQRANSGTAGTNTNPFGGRGEGTKPSFAKHLEQRERPIDLLYVGNTMADLQRRMFVPLKEQQARGPLVQFHLLGSNQERQAQHYMGPEYQQQFLDAGVNLTLVPGAENIDYPAKLAFFGRAKVCFTHNLLLIDGEQMQFLSEWLGVQHTVYANPQVQNPLFRDFWRKNDDEDDVFGAEASSSSPDDSSHQSQEEGGARSNLLAQLRARSRSVKAKLAEYEALSHEDFETKYTLKQHTACSGAASVDPHQEEFIFPRRERDCRHGYPASTNVRVVPQVKARGFEAAFGKCLNLVLRDPWGVFETFFEPGKHFLYVDSIDQAINIARYVRDVYHYKGGHQEGEKEERAEERAVVEQMLEAAYQKAKSYTFSWVNRAIDGATYFCGGGEENTVFGFL